MITDFIIIPGWSSSASFMAPLQKALTERLPSTSKVYIAELPSSTATISALSPNNTHNQSSKLGTQPRWLKQWAAKLLSTDKPLCLVGWSFGGVIANLIAAQYPEKVRALANLSSTPCFVARDGWPTAIDPQTFVNFQQSAKHDLNKLLREFSILCSLGAKNVRTVRHDFSLAQQALAYDQQGLCELLSDMQNLDSRQALSIARCPSLHLFAGNDALIPNETANLLQALASSDAVNGAINSTINTTVVSGGHAFWRESPIATAELIANFIESTASHAVATRGPI